MLAKKATVKFTVALDIVDGSAATVRAIQDVLSGAVEFQYGDEWLDFAELLADWLPDMLPEDVTAVTATVKVNKGGLKLPVIDLPDISPVGGAPEAITPTAPVIQSNVASSVAERPIVNGATPKVSARPRTGRNQPRQRLVARRRAGM